MGKRIILKDANFSENGIFNEFSIDWFEDYRITTPSDNRLGAPLTKGSYDTPIFASAKGKRIQFIYIRLNSVMSISEDAIAKKLKVYDYVGMSNNPLIGTYDCTIKSNGTDMIINLGKEYVFTNGIIIHGYKITPNDMDVAIIGGMTTQAPYELRNSMKYGVTPTFNENSISFDSIVTDVIASWAPDIKFGVFNPNEL